MIIVRWALAQAIAFVEACLSDPQLHKLYQQGDLISKDQTKHDIAHAFEVHKVAMRIARRIARLCPEKIDEWTLNVIVPLAAFLHDIGRAVSVGDHAVEGARIAHKYLTEKGLDRDSVHSICRIIAGHRSDYVLKNGYHDVAHAIIVLADKCVGDENRVRWDRKLALMLLTPLRATALVHNQWICSLLRCIGLKRLPFFREDGMHDRVNYAIKHAFLVVDGQAQTGTGSIVLKLKLDERVCRPRHVFQLYDDRLEACCKAAAYMDFLFRVEFNNIRYGYCSDRRTWLPVHMIVVKKEQ